MGLENLKIVYYLTFDKSAHSERVSPDDADDVVVLGMEADLSDTGLGAGHRSRGGDHLPLLPEEVDQLKVWSAALRQQVLGVVREGEGDDFMTLEFRTPKNLPSLVSFQIVNN